MRGDEQLTIRLTLSSVSHLLLDSSKTQIEMQVLVHRQEPGCNTVLDVIKIKSCQ